MLPKKTILIAAMAMMVGSPLFGQTPTPTFPAPRNPPFNDNPAAPNRPMPLTGFEVETPIDSPSTKRIYDAFKRLRERDAARRQRQFEIATKGAERDYFNKQNQEARYRAAVNFDSYEKSFDYSTHFWVNQDLRWMYNLRRWNLE